MEPDEEAGSEPNSGSEAVENEEPQKRENQQTGSKTTSPTEQQGIPNFSLNLTRAGCRFFEAIEDDEELGIYKQRKEENKRNLPIGAAMTPQSYRKSSIKTNPFLNKPASTFKLEGFKDQSLISMKDAVNLAKESQNLYAFLVKTGKILPEA